MEEITEKERPGAVWIVLYALGVILASTWFSTWFADGWYAFVSSCVLSTIGALIGDHVYGWFTR